MNIYLDIPQDAKFQIEQIVKDNNTTIEYMLKEFILTTINLNKKRVVSTEIASLAGALAEYANPDLWEQEKTAWEEAAVEKYTTN